MLRAQNRALRCAQPASRRLLRKTAILTQKLRQRNSATANEGATPSIFSCVFVDCSNKTFCKMIFFSRSYTISSIYILVVGNIPNGKRHISRTEPVHGKQNIWYLRLTLIFIPTFWYRCQISSIQSSTRRTPQKRMQKYHSTMYWST